MDPEIRELYDKALAVRENAHCPISGFKVGVAVKDITGKIYTGCNVESVTFNNSTHAEMNAIDSAIADGAKKISDVLVLTDGTPAGYPCALCRQKIAEFGMGARVIASNLQEQIRISTIAELYPEPFVQY